MDVWTNRKRRRQRGMREGKGVNVYEETRIWRELAKEKQRNRYR